MVGKPGATDNFEREVTDQDKKEFSKNQPDTLDEFPKTEISEESLPSKVPKKSVDAIDEEVSTQAANEDLRKIQLFTPVEQEEHARGPFPNGETAKANDITEVQTVDHEEIKAALEKFSSSGFGSPPPIVRHPSFTRVSRSGTEEVTENATSVGNKVQEEQAGTRTIKPWAQQEQILLELLGNGQHFTPQKVIDNKIENVNEPVPEPDKYPKAPLSWLSEFKRT